MYCRLNSNGYVLSQNALQPANISTKMLTLKEFECILKLVDWNVICLT